MSCRRALLWSWTYVKFRSSPFSNLAQPRQLSEQDVDKARLYCSNLLQKFDSPSYILQTFIPPSARDAYLSIRALNIELARIPEIVSNPTVGVLRFQFWRDSLDRTFTHASPKEPVAILSHHALLSLRARHPGLTTQAMKAWFLRLVNAREQYMDNRPYTDMAALETYAENTYSTSMYLTLANIPVNSLGADHLVSHIGKATGIVAILRGVPLLAIPPPLNHHNSSAAFGGKLGESAGARQGSVLLPLDVMAETGVKEEDVLRNGTEAPGLKDAIFTIATRANDHLITTREMLKNLQQGKDAGHDFEHEDEHQYAEERSRSILPSDLDQAFGVFMPAVSTRLWLEKLEKHDFDIFHPQLRIRDWKLPWKAYWAYSRRVI